MRDLDFLSVAFAAIIGFVLGVMVATPQYKSIPPVRYSEPIQDVLPPMGQQ